MAGISERESISRLCCGPGIERRGHPTTGGHLSMRNSALAHSPLSLLSFPLDQTRMLNYCFSQ